MSLSSRLQSRTRQYPTQKGKILTEHLILPSLCPDFVLSRTLQFLRQKHTPEHLFYRTAPSDCFKCKLFFKKGKNRKKTYTSRSSRPEVFCAEAATRGVLRNILKFKGKHLCQSPFFNKVAALRSATLLKKRLWHRSFLVHFKKFLRTPVLRNTSGRLLFSVNKGVLKNFTKFTGKQLCQSFSFNKFADLKLRHKCFPENFVKISITPLRPPEVASIPPLCLIHLKPCNCIKIKILFTHNSEKNYPNLSFKFVSIK